jgi:flavin-dependent dehydrogenase
VHVGGFTHRSSSTNSLHTKNPGKDGTLRRSDRVPDVPPGLSRFQQIVLHQGRIERFFLDHIKKHSNDTLRVERAVLPETLHIDDNCDDHSPDNYPITVQLRYLTKEEAKPAQSKGPGVNDGLFRSNLAEDDTDALIAKSREKEGNTESVRAKYMVGCDGAHSWTRGQLGFKLEGEPTDYIWGVLGASTFS